MEIVILVQKHYLAAELFHLGNFVQRGISTKSEIRSWNVVTKKW